MIKQITYIHLGEGDVGISPATGKIDGIPVLGVSFSEIKKQDVGTRGKNKQTEFEYMSSPVVIQATNVESINALISALQEARRNFLIERAMEA